MMIEEAIAFAMHAIGWLLEKIPLILALLIWLNILLDIIIILVNLLLGIISSKRTESDKQSSKAS